MSNLKRFQTLILAMAISLLTSAVTAATISLGTFQDITEIAAPALGASSTARLYADSTSHTLKVSLNGAAFTDLLTTAGTTYPVAPTGGTTTAAGTSSVSVGPSATCAGNTSISLGDSATCAGANSVTLGRSATCATAGSVSIGQGATCPGTSSVAIGKTAIGGGTGTGTQCVAIGNGSVGGSANAGNNVAIGYNATVSTSSNSIAIGQGATTGGAANCVAIGQLASATGGGVAIGWQTSSGSGLGTPFASACTDIYLGGVLASSLTTHTFHGVGSNTNGVNGSDIAFAGGIANQAADAGGALIYQTAASGAGTTLSTRLTITAAGTIDASPSPILYKFQSTTKTSGYTVLTGDTNTVFDNSGASAQVIFTLPTPARGLTYTFIVATAQNIRITATGSSTIRIAGSATATNGHVDDATIGGSIQIIAISTTQWIAVYNEGTWTLTWEPNTHSCPEGVAA